ncbi:MAG: tetratricopeptide repeat protein [Verrucomicrobia bacterium]|nr:tetratricopeptide repeat protein [Verrucomicrobiota bacterium]
MADIEFDCPYCAQHLVVDGQGAGLDVPCPRCSKPITIPKQLSTNTAAAKSQEVSPRDDFKSSELFHRPLKRVWMLSGIVMAVLLTLGGVVGWPVWEKHWDTRSEELWAWLDKEGRLCDVRVLQETIAGNPRNIPTTVARLGNPISEQSLRRVWGLPWLFALPNSSPESVFAWGLSPPGNKVCRYYNVALLISPDGTARMAARWNMLAPLVQQEPAVPKLHVDRVALMRTDGNQPTVNSPISELWKWLEQEGGLFSIMVREKVLSGDPGQMPEVCAKIQRPIPEATVRSHWGNPSDELEATLQSTTWFQKDNQGFSISGERILRYGKVSLLVSGGNVVQAIRFGESKIKQEATPHAQQEATAQMLTGQALHAQQSDAAHKLLSDLRAKAEKGDAEAQYTLGACYAKGKDVPKDAVEAVKWWRKATEQNYVAAQCNLGFCYAKGEGVVRDQVEAVKWYRKAADQNYAQAQYNLGCCYAGSEGVMRDFVEAVKWWRKAAEQDYALAQYNLGIAYSTGQGVTKHEGEAVKWYRKAAEQNHADAQYNLGCDYAKGEGVVKDVVEAVKWYRKAAEQNHAYAQLNLANCYAKSEGVASDEAEYYKWINLAAAQGLDLAKAIRHIIEIGWSPERRAKGQRLVREFQAKQQTAVPSGNDNDEKTKTPEYSQQKPREGTCKEGIFTFKALSNLTKIQGSKAQSLKSQMMQGGRELAEASGSADPNLFTESSLTFFSAYELAGGDLLFILMGDKSPVEMNRDEMFNANSERIRWGKNSNQLSSDSKGVSKLDIDGIPSLLMDIVSPNGERLQTYTFFVPDHPKHSFAITFKSSKGQHQTMIDGILGSLKIVRAKASIPNSQLQSKQTGKVSADNNTMGMFAMHSGDEPSAIRYFEEALKQDSANMAVYCNLASAYSRKGDSTKAIEILNQVIAKKPDFVVAHVNLGGVYAKSGDYNKARAHFHEAGVRLLNQPGNSHLVQSYSIQNLKELMNLEKKVT